MTLVLTSAGMTGSPLNIPVALTTTEHTTESLIATAARTALAAVTVVAERFTVGGTGADITLARKGTSNFTVVDGTLPIYPANDATLNLAIPSGLGITAAPTSTNTTAGVATTGVKLYDAGVDFEGRAIATIGSIQGLQSVVAGADVGVVDGDFAAELTIGEIFQRVTQTALICDTWTVDSSGGADITITVVGTP